MPCADQNGIPVMRTVVLGGTTCKPDTGKFYYEFYFRILEFQFSN